MKIIFGLNLEDFSSILNEMYLLNEKFPPTNWGIYNLIMAHKLNGKKL